MQRVGYLYREYFVANKITEGQRKKAVLLTVIVSKAYGMLRNLLLPTKPVEKEFNGIIQVIQNHLILRPLIIAERFKFHQRSQGKMNLLHST